MSAIHIFKAGTHTDMHGKKLPFTPDDLAACVKAYDPSVHEAPLVIGHPRTEDPAWGWVKALSLSGVDLMAEPAQLDPQFAEMVTDGRFKKVSASFYLPDSPSNPKPGVLYLRHVGFLGAQPPSVKGLKQVSFSEQEEGVVEFADWQAITNASLWGKLRDFLISRFSLDEAEKVLPEWQLNSLREEAYRDTLSQDAAGAQFSETGPGPSSASNEESSMTKEEIEEAYEKNTGVLIADEFEARGKDYIATPAVLCKNHGPFTWGKDANEAVHNAVVLEEVAKMACRCELINPENKPAPQELQDKHYSRKHGANAYYGQGGN